MAKILPQQNRRADTWFALIGGVALRFGILILLAVFMYRMRTILIVVILSAMLAYAIHPVVDRVSKFRILKLSQRTKRFIASLFMFILLFIALGYVVQKFTSPVVKEVSNFDRNYAQIQTMINEYVVKATAWHNKLPDDIRTFIDDTLRQLNVPLTRFLNRIGTSATNVLPLMLHLILIPILAFYFVFDYRAIKREVMSVIPRKYSKDAIRIIRESGKVLQNYVIGQIILCAIATMVVFIILNLAHVKYAMTLSIFAGVTRAIPIVGPIFSGVPIVALALAQDTRIGLIVLIAFTLMHFIESKLIMPKLIGDRVHLHAVTVIIVLLIGSEFFGLMGMFLAAPIASILKVLSDYYIARPSKNSLRNVSKGTEYYGK